MEVRVTVFSLVPLVKVDFALRIALLGSNFHVKCLEMTFAVN